MKKAYEFELMDADEKKVSLTEFKGKWVVVYFYPKDNTPGCTIEAKDFTKIKNQYPELEIIGISPDSSTCHKKFREKQELDILLLADVDKTVIKQYNAWGDKKSFGKIFEGVNRSTFLIDPEGMIVKEWRSVSISGHAEEVANTYLSLKKD
tara:strand:+ start:492 stop:944 length:453 start_codon:yes stop_codon:yes gene_type:complete